MRGKAIQNPVTCLLFLCVVATPASAAPHTPSAPEWLDVQPSATRTLLPDGSTFLMGAVGSHSGAQLLGSDGTSRALSLMTPRTAATATVLPNGKVLIWGGLDAQSHIVRQGEWFDPASNKISVTANIPLLPRAGHTATVLTDGRLLITGGWNPKLGPLTEAELWDYQTNTDQLLSTDLVPARSGHSATLLPDGRVLILGGYDPNGHRFADGALFDPKQVAFVDVDNATAAQLQEPSADTAVAQSIPADRATNFPYDGLIAFRFTAPLAVTTLSTKSITLMGPSGPVAIRVVPAEAGRLVFVRPVNDLLPATAYTLFVSGAQRPDGTALPLTTVSFTTGTTARRGNAAGEPTSGTPVTNNSAASGSSSSTSAPSALVVSTNAKPIRSLIAGSAEAQRELQANCGNTQRIHGYQFCHRQGSVTGGVFTPGFGNTDAHWQVGKPTPKVLALADLPAGAVESGATAVFGTVRRIDDAPLPGASVSIGDRKTTTDSAGRFVLNNVPAGHQVLLVDGSSANHASEQYGEFYAAVTVKDKQANALPFNLYVPRITARDEVAIPAPTDEETVISHLAIPGLEIHLPAGTVLRDRHGKILTHIALVPMPSDRSPVPLPGNFPVYFSVQPATAVVQNTNSSTAKGVELVYPNYVRNVQGLQHLFWIYDAGRGGWMTYTNAYLSSDRAQVKPENDLGLNMPMPAGYTVGGPNPPSNPPPPGACGSGAGGAGGGPASGNGGSGPPGNGPALGGDPVDCRTGTFMYRSADFHIKDVTSLDLVRTFSTAWNTAQNAGWNSSFIFGRGVMHNYAMYLYSPTGNGGGSGTPPVIDLVLPNGSVIPFNNISGNLVSGGPGLWVSHAYPREFYGARLINNEVSIGNDCSYRLCLILSNGTVLGFPAGGNSSSPSWVDWVRDRYGNKTNFSYVGNGQLKKITSPNGRSLTFDYTNTSSCPYAGLVCSVTDSNNRTITYSYVADTLNSGIQDLLHQINYPDGTSEIYGYDAADRLNSVTDRRGNVVITINNYDSQGRVSQQTLGDGAVYHWSYGSNYTDVTDPRNHVRHIVFDAKGYPLSVTRANGTPIAQTTTFVRGQDELVTLKTDSLGRQTHYLYDPSGNLLQETSLYNTASAVTSSYNYTVDGFNQVQSTTDPLGHTTSYSYTNGCLTGITDALGHTTTIVCNSVGQPVTVTDANSNSTIYGYNSTHDLHTVTNALGYTTIYTTDSLGRVTAIQDPLGNKTQIQYDTTGTTHYSVADPPMATIDAMNKTTSYGYDNNVNLTSVTDPNNGVTKYGYDNRNRRNSRTDALQQTETWNCDGNGNLQNYTDRNGDETIYNYDELDRPSLITYVPSRFTYANGSTVTPTFDAGNRLTNVVDSMSGTITRHYDDLDRLLNEQTPQGAVQYTYDAAGRRQTMTAGSQPKVTYTFDAANRLTRITQGTETVQIGYDNADRRTTLGLPNGVIEAYGYDAANELLNIGYTNATGVLGNLQYTYDANGQRIGQVGGFATPSVPTALTGTYDANNRATVGNGSNIYHDANGDTIASGGVDFAWDLRHRLIQTSGVTSANFAYDTFGRRISKTIGSTTTTYLYDGNNPVQETTGSTVHTLLTGLGIDERYARDDAAYGRTYFLTDALGSTLALTDSTGTVQQTYAYEPYGEVTASGNSDNPYQYTGRENDGTGLYYYRARYYSPTLKRFISEDPMGLAAGLNEYAYANDNPINRRDPFGKDWQSDMTYTFCPDGSCLLPHWTQDPYDECTFRCLLELIPLDDLIESGIADQIKDDLGRFVFEHLASRANYIITFIKVMKCYQDCKAHHKCP